MAANKIPKHMIPKSVNWGFWVDDNTPPQQYRFTSANQAAGLEGVV